jgi:transposase InsO family protein
MDVGRFLVEAHLKEGRPVAELARQHGVHRSWLYKLIRRYKLGGEEALAPRSRRPHRSPTRVATCFEDEIVAIRKELSEHGFDAGATTIREHLERAHLEEAVPSVSSIWRILRARGFVTPQPHKRPKSSYVRFVAALPNETWQADMTHWALADGSAIEILNIIDDHSRLCVCSRAFLRLCSPDVVRSLHNAAAIWGFPETFLSDNGAIFTAKHLQGVGAMEAELLALGIGVKHSRPYHPQTCGKVERFHQTMKKYLSAQDPPATKRQLQGQLDRFVAYYNTVRPHRAIGRKTPLEAFTARTKAHPTGPKIDVSGYRVRRDKVDRTGTVTLRFNSRLHHIGVGRPYAGKRVIMLIAGKHVSVIGVDGSPLRRLKLDPTKDYQPIP